MVLSEGSFLTVQAVVTQDRKYVRVTVNPTFLDIEKVETFEFTGEEGTTVNDSSSTELDERGSADDQFTRDTNDTTVSTNRSGTSVQLPTISSMQVSTTVSVPDGGTILLGGIKRLSEGRNEFGVPMLNKIPYLNRLFSNVSVGRETQSLMMMVTPRIIIQEEEEAKMGMTTQ